MFAEGAVLAVQANVSDKLVCPFTNGKVVWAAIEKVSVSRVVTTRGCFLSEQQVSDGVRSFSVAGLSDREWGDRGGVQEHCEVSFLSERHALDAKGWANDIVVAGAGEVGTLG